MLFSTTKLIHDVKHLMIFVQCLLGSLPLQHCVGYGKHSDSPTESGVNQFYYFVLS